MTDQDIFTIDSPALPYDVELLRLPSDNLITLPLGRTIIIPLASFISDSKIIYKHFYRTPQGLGFSHLCLESTGECEGCERGIKREKRFVIPAAYYAEARAGKYIPRLLECGYSLGKAIARIEKNDPDHFVGHALEVFKHRDSKYYYRYFAYPTSIAYDTTLWGTPDNYPSIYNSYLIDNTKIARVYDAMNELQEEDDENQNTQ